jgi:hypothetical protein
LPRIEVRGFAGPPPRDARAGEEKLTRPER